MKTLREQHFDKMSIEELCKPISALKQPFSALVVYSGGPDTIRSERDALKRQRMGATNRRVSRQGRAS